MSTISARIDRRGFLKGLSAGLLVALCADATWTQESGRGFGGHELPNDISAWIHIAADGRVTVFTGKVEVGQNIRTSLAQLVAEELRLPFDRITMIMGDTDLVPWDMGTFGSRSTPTMGPQLRTMAAATRQMLLEQAASVWKIDAASLTATDGKISDGKRSIGYGELTRGKKLVKVVSAQEALTPATDWKIAGTPVRKVGGRDFVTGKHKFPSDISRPGVLHGALLRPGGFNATLVSMDSSAAEAMPGVKVLRDGDFIGVVAADDFAAKRAVASIHAKWNVPSQQGNEGLFEYLKNTPDPEERSGPGHKTGSVEQAMSAAEVKLDDPYTVQYIAHAPLEPRAAVAEWENGKLTVWTGTQRPFGVQEELMQYFKLPAEQVRVIQPDMGSGYGGKHSGEAALEAARLAKAAGKPVKLVWTREEEFTWAYLRPAGLIEIRAGARRDGTLVAWEHHNYNSGPSAIETPYEVPNQLIQYHPAKSPLRQGSYRALAATANNFARESHMDAMAHAVGMDSLEFRLKNLKNERLRAVLQAAAEKFGWKDAKSTAERGFGIACGTDKGGYISSCAEVEIDSSKTIHVRRVVTAWESGAAVNPDGLRNQQMGAIVQALGGALFEHIVFGDGKIRNPLFSQYRLPRFSDTPKIDIVLLDRKDLPSAGAGEIGLIALAPSVGNAIFAATGIRVRNMPLAPGVKVPGIAESPFRS
ncbi:xanthine dehydrogenase family protein molybdopterin-binding subunit [Occallatibacter riparius]|uniref:Molybdopterin-dependent oxidoreductase n=1 Tax=Occallatibacter riparius TaxID=1002689 RepID=A0A9J7BSZ1_9BACT|nr:molybdopterin cofactor-binding domain-containing protein [Occallatibacter riparius]UWZ85768.1 molybdopterin-dependent oxidoreductase [Occallatibacter riparius]